MLVDRLVPAASPVGTGALAGVVQMVATMWLMVMLTTIITYVRTYAGLGDEHGDYDCAGNRDNREW